MTNEPKRQAILFQTHILNDKAISRFEHIEIADGLIDKYILFDASASATEGESDLPIVGYCVSALCDAGYRPIYPEQIVPGSNHFPVIEFSATHSQYAFVWAIEYDVVYTGDWTELMKSVSGDVDFVSTNLRAHADDPHWPWWGMLCHSNDDAISIERSQRFASFNPVYRVSHKAACYLRRKYTAGWRGHHEVTMATLLHHGGFRIEELGGNSRSTPSERRHKYYTIHDTFRWRPSWEVPMSDWRPNCLYHPVKLS
jgi:hypothetical protein